MKLFHKHVSILSCLPKKFLARNVNFFHKHLQSFRHVPHTSMVSLARAVLRAERGSKLTYPSISQCFQLLLQAHSVDPWFDSSDSEYLRASLINEKIDTPGAGFAEPLALTGNYDFEWSEVEENNNPGGMKPLLKFEADLFPIPGRPGIFPQEYE